MDFIFWIRKNIIYCNIISRINLITKLQINGISQNVEINFKINRINVFKLSNFLII